MSRILHRLLSFLKFSSWLCECPFRIQVADRPVMICIIWYRILCPCEDLQIHLAFIPTGLGILQKYLSTTRVFI